MHHESPSERQARNIYARISAVDVNQDEVSKVMREMGRKGGLKGGQKDGKARMAALKPEERKELAREAANKRWQKPCRPTE